MLALLSCSKGFGWMARRAPYWSCRCSYRNLREHRKCRGCGKAKPPKRGPAHSKVLREKKYEDGWPEFSVAVHGGELHHCAVCGRAPTKVKRHDRDHCHRTGRARGVTCSYCNRERLRGIADVAEARLVLEYFERVERYYQTEGGQSEDGSSFTD